ncbi:MAG: type I-C CRISPR-associated protein Cas8c/Csd1 [Nitrospirae bacterium]|nr:type I-C CRISPR-associated protein Cas8c/Csd1 [Nitrospirota bacterium]
MFNELLSLGRSLEQGKKLPPAGFYFYSKKEPIRWVIHINLEEQDKSEIRVANNDKLPRPVSGRTGNVQAYPLADEAAYVLGIDRGKGKGRKISDKHKAFLTLLDEIAASLHVHDLSLSETVREVKRLIESKQLEKSANWGKIESKDWISIQIEGEKSTDHLIESHKIQQFWIEKLASLCKPERKGKAGEKVIKGECGLSGKSGELAGRIPLSVKLYKPAPLHSLNADAFVSGMEGSNVFKRAHVGQSIEYGDLIARTLNYLSNAPIHHKVIAKAIEAGKLNADSHNNLFAFYWIEQQEEKQPAVSISVTDLLANAPLILGGWSEDEETDENAEVEKNPKIRLPADLSQLEALLNVPWSGQTHSLGLDKNAFCLLMLSPNKGRISIREWFKVSLERMRMNIKRYLDSLRIEDPEGKNPRCFTIQEILQAVEAANISQPEYKAKELANPNVTRALLRSAYLGEAPPISLLECAVTCLRHPKVLKRYEQKHERERFAVLQQQLVSVMKLILTHHKSEVNMNNNENQTSLETKSPAFLSGSLFAVLEEAQLASMNWKINTTLVDQFYSTAASAPCSVMGMLVSRVTSQHMPRLRKNMSWKFETVEKLLEELQDALQNNGGFPRTLSLKQQAEFALGFYTRRAEFRRQRP